jgi:uncharacterized SAM-binding protein YcdF (DUF218 family)
VGNSQLSPVVTKLIWLVLNPANLLLAALVLGSTLLFTSRRRLGRWLVAATVLSALLVSFAPLEVLLLEPLQNRFPTAALPKKIDGIIVLGGAVDARESNRQGRLVLNSRAERITASIDLAQRFPDAKFAYTGGSTGEVISEAELVRPLLLKMGIAETRIILETRSRDTFENAMLTRELLKADTGKTWILVTSASHMPRAMGAFRKAGWNVVAYPVDFRRLGEGDETFGRHLGRGLSLVNSTTREWIGLVHYYMVGKSDQLFPSP